MRPSSSTSDAAWLRAMLDVEAGLARVHARAGAITDAACAAIEAACAADDWDAAATFAAGEAHATPVVGLVDELRRRVGDVGQAGVDERAAVHLGATSQDVLDSAAMLLAARALPGILDDARAAGDACAVLAREHRDTPVMARTLLQQARPTAFGLKAAGWLFGIDTAASALTQQVLPVQLAGPVGTGDPQVAARLAAELGLHGRALPWHADRTPIAQLATALGVLAGALAKPCRDVVLLAQTEVREAREAEAGSSSAMPGKRNPAAAVGALAAAHRTPGLVATLLAGMAGEHERAAGAWQAERHAFGDLLDATAGAARLAARSLGGLEVDAGRMRVNAGLATPPADAAPPVDAAPAADATPPVDAAPAADAAPDLGHAAAYVDRALLAHEETWR